jgi:hypothetical protein
MDMHEYLAEAHLAALREQALRERLARAARPARPPLRVTLGYALIRLGHRLLGGFAASASPALKIVVQE